ncbi:MAG: Tm-1-like ATP-binding domain-containing protein, partial [Alphaproteobacteria bacterium]|nr:Tm-1-like ATP-binding domain-containing protein [Alphaproteobacteria bacterium]
MSGAIALIATLDTKGGEVKYLKHRIEEKGGTVHIIDTGMRGAPQAVRADVSREEVAAAAGSSLAEVEKLERGHAIEVMRRGLVKVMIAQYEGGAIAGALAIGGQDGALLAAHALQALPLGLPKMIVTPIAQGSEPFGPYVGTSD